jgi:hypothetical protein
MGQRDFLVNQALLSTKAKSQRRMLDSKSSTNNYFKTMVHPELEATKKEAPKRMS